MGLHHVKLQLPNYIYNNTAKGRNKDRLLIDILTFDLECGTGTSLFTFHTIGGSIIQAGILDFQTVFALKILHTAKAMNINEFLKSKTS